MDEALRKQQFSQLQPLTVALSKEVLLPPKQRLQKQDAIYTRLKDLRAFLQQQNLIWSKNLADYTFFPIMHLLQGITNILDLRDGIRECILAIIDILVSNVWSLDMNQTLAKELLSLSANLSSGDNDKTSDETRLVAAKCFGGIFPSKPALNDVGPIIMLLLQWGEKGGSVELREQSWMSLLALFEGLGSKETAQILPGVVSGVSKVVNGHYKVAVAALKVLRQVTVTALHNGCKEDEKWLEYTRKQYLVTLKTISTRKHDQTNAQLILLCSDIVGKCNESLENCLPICVDILLSLDATEEFLKYESKLELVLDERMYVWLDNLPSLLTRNDDTEPLAVLKCLKVGMKLQKEDGPRGLLVEKLVEAVNSVNQHAIVPAKNTKPSADTPVNFVKQEGINTRAIQVDHNAKHVMPFRGFGITTLLSDEVQAALEQVVVAADVSFEEIQSSDEVSQLWMSNLMLKSDDWLVGMSDDKFDAYELENYYIDALKSSKQQYQFLALQGIGLMAAQTPLNDSLMDILYPILALVPSNHGLVGDMARETLLQLSTTCGYSSVQNMMVENADYLVDSISLAIQTMDVSPGTFQILTVLIKLAGSDIVGYLDDVVKTLFRLLDSYHGYPQLVESVISVFTALIEVMEASVKVKRVEDAKKPALTLEGVLEELRKRQEKPEEEEHEFESHPNKPFGKTDDKMDEDEDQAQPPGAGEEPEKWTGTLAKPTYMLVKQIFGYVQNLITSDSPKLVVSLSRLVSICAPLLAGIDEDQQSEYLPSINDLYPLLENGAFSDDIVVAESCLSTISVLLQSVDASFMRSRMVDLFPRLQGAFDQLLGSASSAVDHKTRRAAALLSTMTVVVDSVTLPTIVLTAACFTCRAHLASSHSREAVSYRRSLQTANPDMYQLFLTRA
ncbi:TEL2-interacting protein 1 [Yarrowia sp. C11]|nr:TEL2-interacting protein 1 [Yarrowia sp. E02]KAG5372522.1 TEL2-interacting protein 1 [Yarrowia sp. C11]